LNLEIKEHKVYFNKIWNVLEEKERYNIAIGTLHWINRDFIDKFGKLDMPRAKKLKEFRHALEHKFVSVHISPAEKNVKIGEDFRRPSNYLHDGFA